MTLRPMRIAWTQISHQKLRLLAAVLGVAFAVILVLVQLGFSQDQVFFSSLFFKF